MKNMSQYRPDIDGLRAIAILSVLLFHLSNNLLKGGFVGVDIFFVISGFLITGILLRNFDPVINNAPATNNARCLNNILFILASFYARRVRRIFPTLIIVLICCYVAGFLFLTKEEMTLLCKHIFAGAIYISNFILLTETGYFDTASELKPLLHLWSLGIEEQFYIIWPLFIIFILYFKRYTFFLVSIFTIASFLLNISIVDNHPERAFYYPHCRFWELSIGACIACYKYRSEKIHICSCLGKYCKNKKLLNLLSVVGLLILLFSLIRIDPKNNYPGVYALFPTCGSALLILVGPTAFINKLLSNKLFVFIGVISYPLYLWHWPLLAFPRILYGGNPSIKIQIAMIAISVFLSYISYRYIEPPLRWGRFNRIKAVSLFCSLLCLGFLAFYHFFNQKNSLIGFNDKNLPSVQYCLKKFPHWGLKDWTDHVCHLPQNGKVSVAVIGDSFAEHLYPGLVNEFENTDNSVAVFPTSGNVPFLELTSATTSGPFYFRKKSYLLHKEAFNYIFSNDDIKVVVLSHNPICSFENLYDNSNLSMVDKSEILRQGAIRTFNLLKQHDKKVIFVLATPVFSVSPQLCISERRIDFHLNDYSNLCAISRESVENESARLWFNKIVLDVAKEYDNVYVFDGLDSICTSKKCSIAKNDKSLYRDSWHLNEYGSKVVAKDLAKLIKSLM